MENSFIVGRKPYYLSLKSLKMCYLSIVSIVRKVDSLKIEE